MRSLLYVALAITVLVSSDAVAATAESNQHLMKTATDFVAPEGIQESRKRFLRANHNEKDELESLIAADEERDKFSGLQMMAKELKMRRSSQKQLAAAVKKMKAKPKGPPAGLNSVTDTKFAQLARANKTPKQALAIGKIKKTEVEAYQKFFLNSLFNR
ncbi:hypothetical protein PHYPSEUDO_003581 [Phytophthora pseudosyringae]|uniref:RxLR effector protein n=1 Tax=Phytophthora pseudosyringae TaxID=221518 RepID=A0A8T1VVJ0_9STRA|nr:hypothetical protein PHYPSEUDO_003581 [Phytophthora pseudosyringae]